MADEPHFLTERPREGPESDFESDLHTEHQILNMGPSHPATHGTVKFLIELDGETIVDLDIQVGYLHRGFEKECESGTWYQAIPYTDRLNYCSAILANHQPEKSTTRQNIGMGVRARNSAELDATRKNSPATMSVNTGILSIWICVISNR